MILNYTTDDVIREKIEDGFCNVFWPGLMRFWVPVKTTSATTSEQQHSMLAYRLLCCFDHLNKLKKKVDDDDDSEEEMMLISGPPADAILNRLPEIVLDLSVYKWNPLMDSALECGFTCSLFLPVFIYRTTSCIGILECSMTLPSELLRFFSSLKIALLSFHRVGLNTFHAQECHPYKVKPLPLFFFKQMFSRLNES